MADHDPPPGGEDPTQLSESDLENTGGGTPSRALGRLGDFELLREIGRGGMGVVYEARQISLNRRVALKVLPPGLGLTDQAVKRFEREAQAAAKLHHTNIVPVHAIGQADGSHFYATELIEGQPLSDVLRDLSGAGSNPLLDETVTKLGDAELVTSKSETSQANSGITSLSDTQSGSRKWFDAVAKLIADVADALEYAHGRGVIHRDIKPANLMLSKEGRLCVTDFGLARVAQEPGMTVSGSLLGTPAYMSPEQIAVGRVTLDHRTDVYSLGTVLYEVLAQRRPFPGESREAVLSAILTKDPRPPRRFNPRVPLDLETIALKAMEKDPDRRYATAAAMAHDLRQHLHGGLIAARRAGPIRRIMKLVRRRPAATVAVVATALVIGLVGFAWQMSAERSAEAAMRRVAEARYHLSRGAYRKGLAAIESALAGGVDSAAAHLIHSRILVKLNRYEEALAQGRSLLEKDSEDWTGNLILAMAAYVSVVFPLVYTTVLLIFRILLRRRWLASLAWVAFVASTTTFLGSGPAIVIALAIAMTGLMLFVLLRFGFLAFCVLFFFSNDFALTLDLSSWYVTQSMATLFILAAIAVYGFYTSLGGRSVFSESFLDMKAPSTT